MKTYTEWDAFINKGRDKIGRPIGTNRRVLRNLDGSIALRLHHTDVVTLYADGTEVINTGGWNSQLTTRFLAEHSKARVWSDGGLKVERHNPPLSPAKLRKCRACKGTGIQPAMCYGGRWCYEGEQGYEDFGLGAKPDKPCEHGHTEYHRIPCEHGSLASHVIGTQACSRCDGNGKADYGSKPIHYAWDGGPLKIDSTGQPLGPKTVAFTKPTEEQAEDYADSRQLLTLALPALDNNVSCPGKEESGVSCPLQDYPLANVIVCLNDIHRWTREAIAEWLDSLDIDLTFPVPDEIPAHIH